MSKPNHPPIGLATAFVRSPEQVSGDLDGAVVLLSIENGKYYHMNEVGSRIWELAAEPLVVSALVDRLVEEFEVERDECEGRVVEFVGALAADGLVEIRPDAPANERERG